MGGLHPLTSPHPQLGVGGLHSLSGLSRLAHLDLSYTEVSDLSPLYKDCPALTALNLASCRSLQADSLLGILPHRWVGGEGHVWAGKKSRDAAMAWIMEAGRMNPCGSTGKDEPL